MKLDIRDKNSILDIEYNFEAYQDIKKVEGSKYNPEDDTWEIDNKYIKHLLEYLNQLNIDVVEHLRTVSNALHEHEQIDFSDPKTVIKTIRVNIVKENPKTIDLGFDYDEKVLNLVKSIEGRTYNPKDRTWRVGKNNIDWLYVKLEELKYVDVSALKKYTSRNSEVNISPKDFPKIKIKPKDYQIDTTNKLIEYKKVINGLEAGLGKTAITVMACEYIKEPTLIVCPASVKYHWEREILQINEDADITVLDGKSEWQDSQYVILNYDILEKFIDDIMDSNFNILVIDEAHKIRGVNGRGIPTSKRAKYTIQIAKKMKYVFPITATPYINQTKDIFNQLKVIEHPLADSWYRFANTYCGVEKTRFGVSYNGSSNIEQLNERLYPHGLIRLRTEDHIDLPERIRSFVPVKISMSKYEKAVKEYMDNRENLETNGQHLVYLTAMRKELAIAKARESVKMVKDLLEQNKSVVLFTNYTEVVEYLYKQFEKDAVVITGDIEDKKRQESVDLFQEGKKKVFIGNIEAASEGITLTKSHHMIVIDFHWSPIVMVEQMEKRIHRLTQNQPCVIQYLYVPEAKIDQIQLSQLERKLNDSSMILDGKKVEFFAEEIIGKMA